MIPLKQFVVDNLDHFCEHGDYLKIATCSLYSFGSKPRLFLRHSAIFQ